MWDKKILRVIPAIVFLFCILEIFELGLMINDLNKLEKLEEGIKNNLNALENITIVLEKHLEGMRLAPFKN
ncbi:hypothetical protein MPG13_03645 [Helicobacter pylori]|uniref:hypothetical protein n=1 Tax=Helicobacter pylori TaxID=210 RepID=UPI001FD5EB84|nr:hypothetical protein [Helicobacter pylori]UOS27824.1 hypothetical protein MPG13_03645 [Helicobacter pylori]